MVYSTPYLPKIRAISQGSISSSGACAEAMFVGKSRDWWLQLEKRTAAGKAPANLSFTLGVQGLGV